ncbi:MAG: carboxypeptidase-like regulatory domain-containing protein [Bacteroidota bacterium]
MKFTPVHFLLVFMVTGSNLSAQTIKGKLLDSATGNAVPFANVYFNASFRGTTSDGNGLFSLDVSEFYGQEIVISCVGYEPLTIKEYKFTKFYEIYLKPQVVMLEELVIEPDDMPRQDKLEVFIKEFIGDSPQAKQCTINNLDELRLVYFKSTSTLEGYSDKPLRIHNRALGYRIKYFLEEFKKSEKHFGYRGNSLFEENITLNRRELRRVERKRKSVYYGSRMHFFRALWSGQLKHEKFIVMNRDDWSELSATEIVQTDSEDQNIKYLLPVAPLRIIYKEEHSNIDFEGDEKVLFTKNGYFNPNHLRWEGVMARHRIGDLLPYGYWPEGRQTESVFPE